MYKHGLQFHTSVLFMLAWPYSADSVRLMSSYAFKTFMEGPPGVELNSWKDNATRVYKDTEDGLIVYPRGCRTRPTTSPVTSRYDDNIGQPWVCEHRWQGVGAFVRLRKLLGGFGKMPNPSHLWSDEEGHIMFAVGGDAFFAFSRGYNTVSKHGPKEDFSLVGKQTGLPGGIYCNLAEVYHELPDPAPPGWTCGGAKFVHINNEGNITTGTTATLGKHSGNAVALHVNYRMSSFVEGKPQGISEVEFTPTPQPTPRPTPQPTRVHN